MQIFPRLGSNGPVQKMDPINSVQVAVKADNLGVFYFACNVPMQALFSEDGSMDKSVSHDPKVIPEFIAGSKIIWIHL